MFLGARSGGHGTVPAAGDVTAPTITSSASVSQPENSALSYTLTANEAANWSIVGGADAALFSIVGGALTLGAKDYEVPTDADGNNTYIVQVVATDGSGNASSPQTITVTITDVDETGASSIPADAITFNTQAVVLSGQNITKAA